jgi:hypothetical protein
MIINSIFVLKQWSSYRYPLKHFKDHISMKLYKNRGKKNHLLDKFSMYNMLIVLSTTTTLSAIIT